MSDQNEVDFPNFDDLCLGLYGGLTLNEICARKGLPSSAQSLFEHMGGTERAAYYFLLAQVNTKIKRERLKGDEIKMACWTVGERIRQTIGEIGNSMPENINVAEE